jgi:hypothetical protein
MRGRNPRYGGTCMRGRNPRYGGTCMRGRSPRYGGTCMRGRAVARGVVSSKLVSRVLVVTLRRMSLASGDLNAKKRKISTRTKNLFFGFIVETSATLHKSEQ